MFAIRPNYPMKHLMGLSTPFAGTMIAFSCIGISLFGKADVGLALGFAIVSTTAILLGGMYMNTLADSSLKSSVGIVMMVVGVAVAARTIVSMTN